MRTFARWTLRLFLVTGLMALASAWTLPGSFFWASVLNRPVPAWAIDDVRAHVEAVPALGRARARQRGARPTHTLVRVPFPYADGPLYDVAEVYLTERPDGFVDYLIRFATSVEPHTGDWFSAQCGDGATLKSKTCTQVIQSVHSAVELAYGYGLMHEVYVNLTGDPATSSSGARISVEDWVDAQDK
jgi:hypothetical protein